MDVSGALTIASLDFDALAWRFKVQFTLFPPDGASVDAKDDEARAKYIRELFRVQKAELPALVKAWPVERLRAAFAVLPCTAEERAVLDQTFARESTWSPVGIYAADPDKAIGKDSSAYGVGQVVRKSHYYSGISWPHWCNLHPWYGMQAALEVLRKHAQDTGSLAAGAQAYRGEKPA